MVNDGQCDQVSECHPIVSWSVFILDTTTGNNRQQQAGNDAVVTELYNGCCLFDTVHFTLLNGNRQ